MVFTPSNLFSGVPCPYQNHCLLTNCIFSHDPKPQLESEQRKPAGTASLQQTETPDPDTSTPPAKRRKLTYDNASKKPPSKAEQIRSQLAADRSKVTAHAASETPAAASSSAIKPQSLTRPVSPPTTARSRKPTLSGSGTSYDNNKQADDSRVTLRHHIKDGDLHTTDTTADVSRRPITRHAEGLNPRLIPNDPVGHAKRTLLLKFLHGEMVRLNKLVNDSQFLEYKHLLYLSDAELIKMALDEEEALARSQPQLYANVIKSRIGVYRKMSLSEWTQQLQLEFVKKSVPPTNVSTAAKPSKPIETSLKPEEEIAILPHLVEPNQNRLVPFGYIPTPPTEAEAAQAADAVEASHNYEICERCAARFQVFPDRNEAGLLTSNGPCKYHPMRKRVLPKTKGEIAQGVTNEAHHPCCDGKVGSPGCTESEYHVFKASTPARLAAVLPFITTPDNESPRKDNRGKAVKAVSFDCEMAYTVKGMELVRLTAVTWPAAEELLDLLVRPLGTIIDLNSRFSGVFPEDFSNATPYAHHIRGQVKAAAPSHTQQDPVTRSLPIVSTPQEARALLCSFLKPTTPLIGHAIENDLNAVRLCHPTIIDTVLLFPHPRHLPIRFGLKMLADRYLHRAIQTGGERGHDSKEDAVATGDLVKVKVVEKWKTLSAKGWKFADGVLVGADRKGKGLDAVVGEKRGRLFGA